MPTVLIVEDDAFVREFLARAFVRDGWTIAVASNGEEALSEATRTAFNLLLVDVVLPRGDGVELAARLSAKQPRARVLLMSGHPFAQPRGRSDAPPAPLLQKPFSVRTALTRARAMVATGVLKS